MYDVSFGLLTDNRLCPLYYSYDWSLYYHVRGTPLPSSFVCRRLTRKDDLEGRYFLHAFKPIDRFLKELHGKSFSAQACRLQDPPDPQLCNWHYRQAVQMHVRGYAVGTAINAI